MMIGAVTVWLSERSCFWWINEIGILLEIVGALTVVLAAFRSRAEIKGIPDSWDAELATKLRNIIAAQAFTELTGFGLLTLGLFAQLIGGFA
ncbi:MAG TPA: hypothetical protein VMW07_09450 [Gallionella sp.]|jgi:hypothetical protein|nr:hypothetical protein [Gallionella sp.]